MWGTCRPRDVAMTMIGVRPGRALLKHSWTHEQCGLWSHSSGNIGCGLHLQLWCLLYRQSCFLSYILLVNLGFNCSY